MLARQRDQMASETKAGNAVASPFGPTKGAVKAIRFLDYLLRCNGRGFARVARRENAGLGSNCHPTLRR